jgi:PAS domain-containing protein
MAQMGHIAFNCMNGASWGRASAWPLLRSRAILQTMAQENVAHRPLELILARNLLTNISTPAFLADHRGGLLFYNEAAESLLGMPFQEARDMDPEGWRARFGPFDSARERIPFEEEPTTIALREGRPVHAPLYIRSADGEVHHIEVSAFPLASNQETTGVIGIFWRTKEPSSGASADQ